MADPKQKSAAMLRQGYWYESARPLASLVFVTPMLLFYEVGILLLGPSALRNAADVWLRKILDIAGFSQYFLLPVLTCGLLLAWHHVSRQTWRLNWSVCYGMLLESIVFGFLLMLIAGWQRLLFAAAIPTCEISADKAQSLFRLLVGYVGAGIYEELLFRLILLSGIIGLLRLMRIPPRAAAVTAVVVISLLFSAAHYQMDFMMAGHHVATSHGEAFSWYSFLFRFLAGVYFSLLFLFRGFGISCGAHAMYDIFTLI